MAAWRHPRSEERRAAIRCGVALLLFLPLAACLTTDAIDHGVTPCGALTCGGCCTIDGRCVAGDVFFACGAGGVRCQGCQPEQSCTAGVCTTAEPVDGGPPEDAGHTCDANTCAGCCMGDVCLPYGEQDATRCGASGATCTACATDSTCEAGACGISARCVLTLEPSMVGTHRILDFGAWPVGGTLRHDVVLINTGDAACDVSAPTWAADSDRNAFAFGGATPHPSTLPPGGRASFPVTFTPYAARSWFEETHAFTFVVNDGRPSECAASTPGCRRVRVRGVGITSALSATAPVVPSSVQFGPVEVGCHSVWRDVLLINESAQPLTLQHAGVTGAGFELQPLTLPSTLAPWSSLTLRVRFTPSASGPAGGVLQITDELEGTRSVTLEAVAVESSLRTQSFNQTPAGQADVLFVVHNGSGMASWQETLGGAVAPFIQVATAAGGVWRLGVLTSDATQANAGLLQGSPKYLTPTTPDVVDAFADNVRVGAGGTIDQSLEAVRLSLLPPRSDDPLRNGGFFREEARLGIVLVSNASSKSPAAIDEYVRALRLTNEHRGGLDRVRLYPLVPATGCQSGSPYEEAVSLMGGLCQSLSSSTLSAALKTIAADLFSLRTGFTLGQPVSPGTGVTVSVDGSALVEGTHFTFDAVHNAVRLIDPWIPQPGQQVEVSWNATCQP